MSANESAATRYYTAKEVSDDLDISSSTLRKWCLSLEEQGYEFTRGEQNRRLYSDEDKYYLNHFQKLVQVSNMSLENASIIVASRFKEARSSAGTPSVREESEQNNEVVSNEVIEVLNEHIEKQEQFNKELVKRLEEQNKYISERLDQRDNALMETMNKMMEQRQKEVKLLEEKKKGNWFSRLFGKK